MTSSPPITAHLDPELRGHALGHGEVVEEDDGDGECDGENPGAGHQPLGAPPCTSNVTSNVATQTTKTHKGGNLYFLPTV